MRVLRAWVGSAAAVAILAAVTIPPLLDRMFPEGPAQAGCCEGWSPCPGRKSWKVKVKTHDGKYRFNEYAWYCGPGHPAFGPERVALPPPPPPPLAHLGKGRPRRPDRPVDPPPPPPTVRVVADPVEGEERAGDDLLPEREQVTD